MQERRNEEMINTMLGPWNLTSAFHVECCYCLMIEEVIVSTQQEAITRLQSVGWVVRSSGPWCPDCAKMLPHARKHSGLVAIGDTAWIAARGIDVGMVKQVDEDVALVADAGGVTRPYPMSILYRRNL